MCDDAASTIHQSLAPQELTDAWCSPRHGLPTELKEQRGFETRVMNWRAPSISPCLRTPRDLRAEGIQQRPLLPYQREHRDQLVKRHGGYHRPGAHTRPPFSST